MNTPMSDNFHLTGEELDFIHLILTEAAGDLTLDKLAMAHDICLKIESLRFDDTDEFIKKLRGWYED